LILGKLALIKLTNLGAHVGIIILKVRLPVLIFKESDPLTELVYYLVSWLRLSCCVLALYAVQTEHIHEEVRRVVPWWAGKLGAESREIVDSQTCLIEIYNFPLGKEHQPVKTLEDLAVWLVNSRYNGPSMPCKVFQGLYNLEGGEGVETCSWLIQKDQAWVGDQLHTYGGTLALTPWDPLEELPADFGILALLQVKFFDNFVHTSYFRLIRPLEF
jgi:hypothetical protein